jgi:alpha-amylase/alpha-mannosidase (GH57 family)
LDRFVCVHGHFYQPPRENPWLEAIELQDSAYPYHDWNERITAECYGPNAHSRVLDADGRIGKIQSNYARMSFNIGPTLLKWLQDEQPEVYLAIIDSDRESITRFSGHGSAMGQAYSHMILPLANSRDKYTQVSWGIADFEKRFSRRPEGMWLPETAVDLESLDIMAGLGIRFTILEPGQAKRIKGQTSRGWTDVGGGNIDPSRAYFVRLPSGRRMNLFFYDAPISRSIAFEGVLDNGETFANRLIGGFSDQRHWPQLVHVATDGESYGHHHRFGDMALGYALDYIEGIDAAALTNYSEYLERAPAEWEVEINENTSWSCAHGIERWRSNCGDSSGTHPGWNQEWRAPLRQGMDWLRDAVAPIYEKHASVLFRDPWEARNDYISVILNRDEDNIAEFFARHGTSKLVAGQRTQALDLLELQRHAMLMFASDGWFFDDISGIETTQVLQYAGRVIQLAQKLFGDELEEGYLNVLGQAKSNIPEQGDGRAVYGRYVRAATVDLSKVAAHYAVSSLFEEYPDDTPIYCYRVHADDYERQTEGIAQMAVGRAAVTSAITGESGTMSFGVLHFGDHNITAGVRAFAEAEAFEQMKAEALAAFSKADLPEALRVLDRHFGELTYSLRSLFRDEQRKVLQSILAVTLGETEGSYRQIFEHHAPLMRFLKDIGVPLPPSFQAAAELVINANIGRLLRERPIDADRLAAQLADATAWAIKIDEAALAFAAEHTLREQAADFAASPDDEALLRDLELSATAIRTLPFTVDLADVQNRFWSVLTGRYPEYHDRAAEHEKAALDWLDHFRRLGEALRIRVD